MTQDDADAQFVRYLSHFLVSLGCVSVSSRLIPPAKEQKFFTSGFVIEVGGEWYLVSAGHVFNQIAEYRRAWPDLIHEFVIFSGFGTFATDRELTRFGYRDPVYCVDRPEGLDFGAIKLTPAERSRLSLNGILAVEERYWDQSLPAEFSDFALLGLPFQNMDVKTPGEAGLQPVYLRVSSLPDKPAEYAAHSDPMRYFRVMEPSRSDLNIEGMSGCPVFAFRQQEGKDITALICGVQRSWLPRQRVTTATDLRFAASLLRDAVGAK